MKTICCLLLLLSTSMTGNSQNMIPRFETLGIDEGLSQSSVYSIYQDKTGFMWFGTADGLNRYDGRSIRIYKIKDQKISNSNFIRRNICEDKQHNIWFCNETGIYMYSVLEDRIIPRLKFLKYTWITGIFIDENNIFYILNPESGIQEFDINSNILKTTSCTFAKPYYSFILTDLTTDFHDRIFIKAEEGNGLLEYNTKTRMCSLLPTEKKFRSVFYSNNNLYLVDKKASIYITDCDLKIIDSIRYPLATKKSFEATAVVHDSYNRIWIATTDNALICYNSIQKSFSNYTHDNRKQRSLAIDLAASLFIDKASNLWIGTDGGGVSKLDLKTPKFYLFPQNEGDYDFMKDYFIKCFYEDEKGNIWFGTYSSGLNIFDPVTGTIKNYCYLKGRINGIPGNIVSSIIKDRSGNVWLSTNGGIATFNVNKNKFSSLSFSDPASRINTDNYIFKLTELQNGSILAATSSGITLIKKSQKKIKSISFKTSVDPVISFTDAIEAADHTIWCTAPLRGLFHFRIQNDSLLTIKKYFPMLDLRSIHADEKDSNHLWISTAIGLIYLNIHTDKYMLYDESDGLVGSYVYGVVEDLNHNLWISTNSGLSFFNRKSASFQNYSAKDGLQSNEFNTHAFYKAPSGKIFFGGIKGFNWFDQKVAYTSENTVPAVAITEINVEDKPYIKPPSFADEKKVILQPGESNINFQFAALDFTLPKANKIKFILENWDKKWVTSTENNIRYAHLLPGKYRLRVKAANSDNHWSPEESISIIVRAPYYQQRWFFMLASICFLLLIIYITYFVSQQKIKKRIRDLEKRHAIDAERNRISRDMHDEIGSGLTHIALLSELIQQQEKSAEAIHNDVGSISTEARKLIDNISEIIWALNPQNDNLENLLAYIREQMQQYFQGFDLKLNINFPEELPDIKLSNEEKRNIFLVSKEACNNIMKHAHATEASISFSLSGSWLLFEINDNGTGMNQKVLRSSGNGLKNMKKRIEDIGGTIQWISDEKGLKVKYQVPYKS